MFARKNAQAGTSVSVGLKNKPSLTPAPYTSVRYQIGIEMISEKEHEDKIVVGQRVKLSCPDKDDEYGIVISTWRNPEIGMMKDCYVAFWGTSIPEFDTEHLVQPYILRYAAMSLQPL